MNINVSLQKVQRNRNNPSWEKYTFKISPQNKLFFPIFTEIFNTQLFLMQEQIILGRIRRSWVQEVKS